MEARLMTNPHISPSFSDTVPTVFHIGNFLVVEFICVLYPIGALTF